MVQCSFKRDEQGKLCPNDTYNKTLLTKTLYKYPEQGRFSVGIAKVRKNGSNEDEGIRMERIDYTNRNIRTIDTYVDHMKQKCDRIRKFTGEGNSMWVKNTWPEVELWANGLMLQIKGAGEKRGRR